MKILIITSVMKQIIAENILCDALIEIFKEYDINYTFEQTDSSIDCIALLNKQQLNSAIQIKKVNRIPLVYFFYKSKIVDNYTIDATNIDFTYIINDVNLKIMYPYPYSSQELEMLFGVENETNCVNNNNVDIYISTGGSMYDDSALLKILRALNRLTKCKIEINSPRKALSKILNSNISIFDSRNEIEQKVINCGIVIGAGYAILYAIKHMKPFIVIGERGYGGILNENNLVLQYNSFFQGRIGGKFDDPIPEKLLLEDIEVVNRSNKAADIFKKLLIEQSRNSAHIILAKMTELVEKSNQLKNDFYNGGVIFNPDFTIIKGNGFYWLLNRFTREIIACINSDYYSAIEKCIEHPTPIKKIAITSKATKIIKELLKSKVIISVLKEEDNPQV